VNCTACIGRNCCAELNACANNPDGLPYEECVANCTSARGGGTPVDCQNTCSSSHANGAAACQAYFDCFTQECFNPGC
jgi:hypothetical protein